MIDIKYYDSREEWLAARSRRIGGSEAAALVGRHPYMTNVDLWRIKTGRAEPPEVDNPAVRYGTAAEEHVRALYALDHPDMTVAYRPYNMWSVPELPFAHASLDGWLKDSDGRLGVYEGKTAIVRSKAAALKWRYKVPDNYYCQLLWYMLVTGAVFADLRAYIRGGTDGMGEMRDYHYERRDCAADIRMLQDKAVDFWRYVEDDEEPPLILEV